MTTTVPAESMQHARHTQKAMTFDHVKRVGGLSRIVDRDIEILKMNLVQLQDGRYEARSRAFERLESAWETVRSELTDEAVASPLNGDLTPHNGAVVAAVEVDAPMAVVPTVPLVLRPLQWVTEIPGPAISTRISQVVRWSREPARRAELRAAALNVRSFVSSSASAGANQVRVAWRGLAKVVGRQAGSLESTWLRLEDKWQTWKAAKPPAGDATVLLPPLDALVADLPSIESTPATAAQLVKPADVMHRGNGSTNPAQGDSGGAYVAAKNGSAQARLASAKDAVKSRLASIESESRPILVTNTIRQLDRPTTSSPATPFVVKPLPWFLGALSPVISLRTMMMHHGSHYSQCVESANRLSRDYKNLAGKSPLEIVRWARENAPGTELLWTASEAWTTLFTGSA
jgi:hypothetical protein